MDNNYHITLTPFQLATFQGILDWVECDNNDRIAIEKETGGADTDFVKSMESELELIKDIMKQISEQATVPCSAPKADKTPSAFTMTYHDILDYLGDLGVNTDADTFDDGIVADMANDWIDSCEMSHDRRYRPVTREWVYDRAEEYELEMEDC